MHRGDAYSGHYHAYIRDTLNEGVWDSFEKNEDLEVIKEVDSDEKN